ncbi:Cation diffusion facilitator family transporter [Candidatus Methylobacter favarea]|uniref:Cation diffusion facilitator family transporter n=1 Tax=Candidatus Methylobacter favarea TaxID=2707345 RepID=A0A8S0WXT6_9GAMM|nr:cation diffusion facilitator family transporter [Candidatus Methylobacter favarea]CAA9889293.1 Cation diffusion facilitator family transporter [Candidatus Methylobacter favarea]
MKHDHKHDHAGGCPHDALNNKGRVLLFSIVLNLIFVVIEFIYGFISNSTALMADAGHNASDVLGLLLAWGAVILSRKQPSQRYTYGFRSTSILAALGNAALLLVASGAIAWEAVHRISQPPMVASLTVIIVAAAGIVINGLTAWLLMKGSKEDLNIRGAYLHMLADTAVSLAVVFAGAAMFYSGWYWLDPIISLAIVVVIVAGTWGLLRDSMKLALNAVPGQINEAAIDAYLRQLDGVTDIHDLHIWGLSTTENALTVHLVMPGGHPGDAFMDSVEATLKQQHSIHHCTLQIEHGTTHHACSLAMTGPGRHRH